MRLNVTAPMFWESRVSKEQVALGSQLCQGLPVELRLQDYREVQGQFDAVISIGIL